MAFEEIIKLHPKPTTVDRDALLRCIDECLDCAAACTSCADADLSESDVAEMARCIRLCLDCADVCVATARVVTRQTAPDLDLMRSDRSLCSSLCRLCRRVRPPRRASRALPRVCGSLPALQAGLRRPSSGDRLTRASGHPTRAVRSGRFRFVEHNRFIHAPRGSLGDWVSAESWQ
jgi:hypothetical protein